MIQELMVRADQRGYVTVNEVLSLMEVEGEGPARLRNSFLDELDDLGIELS